MLTHSRPAAANTRTSAGPRPICIRYGSLIAWAKRLGRNDCANLLEQNLQEEKAADKKLTDIAESKVNLRAA